MTTSDAETDVKLNIYLCISFTCLFVDAGTHGGHREHGGDPQGHPRRDAPDVDPEGHPGRDDDERARQEDLDDVVADVTP